MSWTSETRKQNNSHVQVQNVSCKYQRRVGSVPLTPTGSGSNGSFTELNPSYLPQHVNVVICFGTHQLWTVWTDGVDNNRSGSKLISFMMLDRRTGSSCLRNMKEVFSQALVEPGIIATWEFLTNTSRQLLIKRFDLTKRLQRCWDAGTSKMWDKDY